METPGIRIYQQVICLPILIYELVTSFRKNMVSVELVSRTLFVRSSHSSGFKMKQVQMDISISKVCSDLMDENIDFSY